MQEASPPTSRIRQLVRLAAAPSWSTPAIVGLGLLSSLFEGVGLSLFIPLIDLMGAEPQTPSAAGRFFDNLLAPVPPQARVTVLIAAVCLSVFFKNVIAQLCHFVTQYVSGQVAHRLRVRILSQAIESCVDYEVGSRRSDIMTTIANNSWSVGSTLTLVYRMMVCGITIAVFLILMLTVSVSLTAMAVACFGAIAAVIAVATRRAHVVGQEVVAENRAFGMRMWESIISLRLMRAFSREAEELRRFAEASDALRRRLLQMSTYWSLPGPTSEVLGTVAISALILVGYWLGVGVAALAAFLALLYRMQGPMRELMSARVAFDGASAATSDVAEFLARSQAPLLRDGHRPFEGLREGLVLHNVGFRYPNSEQPALCGVSFTVPRGTTTAVVGRSGAGKSTLMDLLFRFRDPTEGQILVDGLPLEALRIASWRSRVAVMSQDVHLLHDTVAANIAYGRQGASIEEVREAARVAGAAAFIDELPSGYGTVIGDAGARLSGGQRQRIALARTILRSPEVLLLDEATNSLDTQTEREFQSALRRYAKGRTVVVIAHRLSTVEDADQVVVLDGGRVAEFGPPAQLLHAHGAFARLHGLQSGSARIVAL